MFRLIDKTHVMPKSLFITDIPFKLHLDPVVIAQIGSVFRGDHKGKHVVLKLVYKGHENVCLLLNLYLITLIRDRIGLRICSETTCFEKR